MKIAVKDLRSNPFRSPKIPFREEKIKQLEMNIESTGFWDNIVARKNDGKYEIAYGHHRLEALKNLGIKEVDIPIKDLDDATMIKMMAQENMEEWFLTPIVALETVKTAYNFLRGKENDCNVAVIADFLKWPFRRVQDALSTLRSLGEINGSEKAKKEFKEKIDLDKTSIEKLPSMAHITEFKKTVRELRPSRKVQKIVAEKISKGDRDDIPAQAIESEIKQTMRLTGELKKESKVKPRPELNQFMEKEIFKLLSNLEIALNKTKGMMQYLSSYHRKIFRTKLKELNLIIQILLKEVEDEES